MSLDSVMCEVSDDIKVLHVSIHIFEPTLAIGEKHSDLGIQDLILPLMFFQPLDISKPFYSTISE